MHGRRRTAQLLPDLLTSPHVVVLLDAAGALRVSLAQQVLKLNHTQAFQLKLAHTQAFQAFGARALSRTAGRSRGEPAADDPDRLVASQSHLVNTPRLRMTTSRPRGNLS